MRYLILVLLCAQAFAACTGSSPTWTSTPDQTSLNTCIANATAGDTINVTAGTATWASNTQINKSLSIIGAGIGNTVITGDTFGIGAQSTVFRVSGFTFNIPNGSTYFNISNGQQGWRIDHNDFEHATWSDNFCIFALGELSNGTSPHAVEGLIDHNTMVNCRIVVYGEYGDTGGNKRWAEALNDGTVHSVYVEDNTYSTNGGCLTGGVIGCNFVDTNNGGRYVARFNTITNSYFEAHSLGCTGGTPPTGGCRGNRLVEIYNNGMTVTSVGGFSRPFFIRAGTGRIFHNTTSTNPYNVDKFDINNIRSCESSDTGYGGCVGGNCESFQLCDGTYYVDANDGVAPGHVCRDQIGTSTDASLWANSTFPNPAPAQAKNPMYIWKNISPNGEQVPEVTAGNCSQSTKYCIGGSNRGTTCTTNGQCNSNLCETTFALEQSQIQTNRDYYEYASSFNGTSGVGEGTFASRPNTCTTGVGYWATDQGSWNTKLAANTSGQLYTCTSTNTWTLSYVPFTYPHPLQGNVQVSTPVISPSNGTFNQSRLIALTGQLGATLCYTIDGTTPTGNGAGACVNGTQYTVPFTITQSALVQAIGTESGFTDSNVASGQFFIMHGMSVVQGSMKGVYVQ